MTGWRGIQTQGSMPTGGMMEKNHEDTLDLIESAFDSQLEALFDQYVGLASSLDHGWNEDKLHRVGNWQRISMLDRMEDGEEFLSDSDMELLARVGAGGVAGYVLDDDQANHEWRTASESERLIAFGFHVYVRIIGGMARVHETMFLFRIASETVGFLVYGNNPGSLENFLVQTARFAANARHSKPGGSRDKRQQIRAIWANGKYTSRDICAEQESAALDMSFSTARKALKGMPDPV